MCPACGGPVARGYMPPGREPTYVVEMGWECLTCGALVYDDEVVAS
jgi:hypothetical protein